MKKAIIITVAIILIGYFVYNKKSNNQITIGIVEPLEHKAMDEIVAGFSETLKNELEKNHENKKLVIKVDNAQNDNNLQRSILQKMKDAHYDMIVPIGTMATQMAAAMIHDRPIISLAASFSEAERKKLTPCNIAVVHDEIPAEKILNFIHETYPNMTKLALIHSSSEKVLPEVKETITAGKTYGITVIHSMVSTLPDLMAVTQALPSDTQGIFVLKDSLIVSGISTLENIAKQKEIPLITSDEGSVTDGALLALGVHEKQIGAEGATLAANVLEGKKACSLPIHEMQQLNVFVNRKTLTEQNFKANDIQNAAKKLSYLAEFK